MNERFPITYLSGAEAYFGPNYGSTTVNTLARNGHAAQCPNLNRLFRQLSFTVPMENAIMAAMASEKVDGAVAARTWLRTNPDGLAGWLEGVTTLDGRDGLGTVKGMLGL